MESVPTYQVFTKKKLENNPHAGKTKKRLRLGYRTFRENELRLLDEVLHEKNLDLEGKYMQIKFIHISQGI